MSRLLIFTFMSFLFLSACKEEEPAPVERTIEDVKEDFNALNIVPGVQDLTLEYLNGVTWNFRLIAPNVSPGVSYPLIIDLHGASGGAADAHMKTDCYLEPGFEDYEVYMIIPNGGADIWTTFNNQAQVVNLTLFASEFLSVDDARVAVTGYSNGGNGAWFFGETTSELFSAAIPMGSSYNTLSTDGSVRIMPVPMYVIHGENDELFPVMDTQNWVDITNGAGSDITLIVAAGLTHVEVCSYTAYFKDGVEWLMTEIW